MLFRVIRQILAAALVAAALGLKMVTPVAAADVTVFAAASLKDALDDIGAKFEAQTGYSLALSLAGSSLLARQIELGAPADIYFPANPDWMNHLDQKGLLASQSRIDLLRNQLVLVAPRKSAQAISSFQDPLLLEQLGEGKLAMGLVSAVPAGIYGKAALQSVGLWQELENHIAQSDNVRAALAMVAIGEAPLGIVYASDAIAEPRVVVLAEFPKTSHPPILYPVAMTRSSDHPAVQAFYTFLQTPEARVAFQTAGFETIAE